MCELDLMPFGSLGQALCVCDGESLEGLSIRKLRRILGVFSQSLRINSSQSWCFN